MERWTKEQKDLLFSRKTNQEIVSLTGRSMGAVRSARYNHTGSTGVRPDIPYGREYISKSEGERRIIALCEKYGVKLKGENA